MSLSPPPPQKKKGGGGGRKKKKKHIKPHTFLKHIGFFFNISIYIQPSVTPVCGAVKEAH